MNYEQKYKEALERAKKMYTEDIGKYQSLREQCVEYIFPELKESENEKIR